MKYMLLTIALTMAGCAGGDSSQFDGRYNFNFAIISIDGDPQKNELPAIMPAETFDNAPAE